MLFDELKQLRGDLVKSVEFAVASVERFVPCGIAERGDDSLRDSGATIAGANSRELFTMTAVVDLAVESLHRKNEPLRFRSGCLAFRGELA